MDKIDAFYSQYVTCAAIGSPLKSNSMSKNLPKRLELLFNCVLALPMDSRNIWAYSMRSRMFGSPPRRQANSCESSDVTDNDSLLSRLRLTYEVALADRDRYRTPRSLELELLRLSRRPSSKLVGGSSLRPMHLAWPQWSHLIESRRNDDTGDKLARFSDALLLQVNKCCSFVFRFRLDVGVGPLRLVIDSRRLVDASSFSSSWLADWITTRFRPVVLSVFAVEAADTFGMLSRLLNWLVKTNSTDLPVVLFCKW